MSNRPASSSYDDESTNTDDTTAWELSLPAPPAQVDSIWTVHPPSSRAALKATRLSTLRGMKEYLAHLRQVQAKVNHKEPQLVSELIRTANTWRTLLLNSMLPALSLPPELMKTVFGFVVEPSSGASIAVQIRLSHVCRRWRSVILGMKHMWSRIHLFSDEHSEKFEVFAARSDPLPIHLSLDVGLSGISKPRASEIVTRKPHRMNSLNLVFLDPHSRSFSLGALSNLETCSISHGSNRPTLFQRGLFHLSDLPATVQFLSIRSVCISPRRVDKLSNLKRLALSFIAIDDLRGILSSSAGSTLEHLEILRMDSITHLPTTPRPKAPSQSTLHHLRILRLLLVPLEAVEVLVEEFPMPALHRFEFGAKTRDRTTPQTGEGTVQLSRALNTLFTTATELRHLNLIHSEDLLELSMVFITALQPSGNLTPAPKLIELTFTFSSHNRPRPNPPSPRYSNRRPWSYPLAHTESRSVPRATSSSSSWDIESFLNWLGGLIFARNLTLIRSSDAGTTPGPSPRRVVLKRDAWPEEEQESIWGLSSYFAPTVVGFRSLSGEGVGGDEEDDHDSNEAPDDLRWDALSLSMENDDEDDDGEKYAEDDGADGLDMDFVGSDSGYSIGSSGHGRDAHRFSYGHGIGSTGSLYGLLGRNRTSMYSPTYSSAWRAYGRRYDI